ncbi:hypothetical protein ND748_00310 [Frankia sp. AiPs1]|uniref:hypothetical protein n=1 Tax=Frankia sp. AiPs1 TaxID=573493 RepID=UPI002044BAF8|nr:hypothetical protein [Frankia sp. AiPs1]MCM3920139.1 hypothetical protein [Frankia sp. AiPs1]
MTSDHRAVAAAAIDELSASRLDAVDNLPGLREAAIDLAAAALSGDAGELMHAQIQHLRRPGSSLFPDAYLAVDAAAEDALQRAGAGLRVALAQAGKLFDARRYEHAMATRLSDDPRFALRAELARVPRPLTRPEPLTWSIPPAPWARDTYGSDPSPWPPSGLETAAALRCLPSGAAALASVEDGAHAGWAQIGMIERHRTPANRHHDCPARQVLIAVGLEVTDTEPPAKSPPFTEVPWQLWIWQPEQLEEIVNPRVATRRLSTGSFPAVALTNQIHTGLGTPLNVLAPILDVVMALRLRPTAGICGFSLSDNNGAGIICRQWHGHLVHDGNVQPLMPAVEGADLLIRPDLFDRLRTIIEDARIRAGIFVDYQEGVKPAGGA